MDKRLTLVAEKTDPYPPVGECTRLLLVSLTVSGVNGFARAIPGTTGKRMLLPRAQV